MNTTARPKVLEYVARQDRTTPTGWYATIGLQLEREFIKALDAADRTGKRIGVKITEKEIGVIMKLCTGQYEYSQDPEVKKYKRLNRVKAI